MRGVVRSAPPPDEPFDPLAPQEPGAAFRPDDARVAQHGEIPGRSRVVPAHAWKVAIVTGLLGFLVAAVLFTVPELVAGESALGRRAQHDPVRRPQAARARTPADTTTTTTPTQTVTTPEEEATVTRAAGETVTRRRPP